MVRTRLVVSKSHHRGNDTKRLHEQSDASSIVRVDGDEKTPVFSLHWDGGWDKKSPTVLFS